MRKFKMHLSQAMKGHLWITAYVQALGADSVLARSSTDIDRAKTIAYSVVKALEEDMKDEKPNYGEVDL